MITVIGKIRLPVEQMDVAREAIVKAVEATRAEEGCITYDLHQNHEDPAHFMFYENWESRELWQVHMSAPHLLAYRAATEDAVDGFTLHEMSHIG